MEITGVVLLGLILGSFYHACIHRYVSGGSILFPPSHCPHCRHRLAWFDLIPVVSFLLLRGKCRYCHTSIGIDYPLVELLSGGIAGALFWRFGQGVEFAVYMAFSGLLIVLSGIDAKTFRLPDCMTLPGITAAGISGAVLLGHGWIDAIGGAVLGYGILWLIASLYKVFSKKDGLGRGDMKVLAMLGALVGINALPVVMGLSAILALGFALVFKQSRLAFGPWLSAGFLLHLFIA